MNCGQPSLAEKIINTGGDPMFCELVINIYFSDSGIPVDAQFTKEYDYER